MKIGFLETFPGLKIPERENITRIKKVFEKMGHFFYVLTPDGFDKNGNHADSLDLDFVFTPDNTVPGMEVFPNCTALSVGWVPCGYLSYSKFQRFVSGIDAFDGYVPAFESCSTEKILTNYANNFLEVSDYFYPSVSRDDIIAPKLRNKYKVFYVGINLDKGKSKGRHYSLLKTLDLKNLLSLYGPGKVGDIVCWEGFKNYKGEIPFDGVSILKKINEAGICLAFQSKIHNKEEYVTNRIYEACAAGAVIITDNNPKIRKFFGDSIYYVDIFQKDEKITEDILKIYNEIQANPQEAYNKAKKAQEIFLDNFTLEQSAKNIIEAYKKISRDLCDIKKQKNLVNVIAFVDNAEDFNNINSQISAQYYKNIKVYFSAKVDVPEKNLGYRYEIIKTQEDSYGKRFVELKNKLSGEYFIFVNGIANIQKRHFTKLVNKMNACENMYCISGTYLKDLNARGKYTVLNDNFGSLEGYYNLLYNQDFAEERDSILRSFEFENKYALHSFMYRKDILKIFSDNELCNMRRGIHLYMALIATYKAKDYGSIISAVSCGYTSEVPTTEIDGSKYYVDLNEGAFVDFNKCEGLTISDLYTVFMKYYFHNYKENAKNKYVNVLNIFDKIRCLDKRIAWCQIKRIFMPLKYNKKIKALKEKKRNLIKS